MTHKFGSVDGEDAVAREGGRDRVEVDGGREHKATCKHLRGDGVALLLLDLTLYHHSVVHDLDVDVLRLEVLHVDHHLLCHEKCQSTRL